MPEIRWQQARDRCKDNGIQILDPSTGKSLLTFPAHTRPIFALQWNRDGSRLISASLDGTVRVWDMLAKQPLTLLVITAHDGGVSSAMLNPDGRTLVTCSGFINLGGIDDLSVRLWEVETGKLLNKFEMDVLPPRKTIWSSRWAPVSRGRIGWDGANWGQIVSAPMIEIRLPGCRLLNESLAAEQVGDGLREHAIARRVQIRHLRIVHLPGMISLRAQRRVEIEACPAAILAYLD